MPVYVKMKTLTIASRLFGRALKIYAQEINMRGRTYHMIKTGIRLHLYQSQTSLKQRREFIVYLKFTMFIM